MKKRIEFPLLELMLIIMLLSMLVFFAFPKWMDIGTEARIKTLNGTVLNLSAVNSLLYSRSVIKNIHHNALQSTDILGKKDAGAYLVYGELRAKESDLRQFLNSDLIEYSRNNKSGNIRLYLNRYKNNACYINYQQARQIKMSDGKNVIQKARYQVKSTGC